MFPRFLSSIISWRSVAILAFVACLSQVTNLILTWQLRQRHQATADLASGGGASGFGMRSAVRSHHVLARRRDHHLGEKLSDEHEAILSRIAHWSVLDGSGEYRVSLGVLRGSALEAGPGGDGGLEGREDSSAPDGQGLTLVTQCSLARLNRLPELVRQWQGPISVAVFALSGEVQAVVQVFHLLRRCHANIKENVTFSLIFPLNSPTSPHLAPTADTTPCDNIFSQLEHVNYDFKGIQYPNNLLRNVARKATSTNLMMVIDIDMTPSPGLHRAFSAYAKDNHLFEENASEEKTVWVVPAYELKEGTEIPSSKTELLKLREEGSARIFYQELCLKCQKYTDYATWEKSTDTKEGRVDALYEVLWQDPWEPFYIARTNVPFYDERFRQYGFNRISQVCELHVAGYRFVVLDSAFVVHEGFKTSSGFHRSKDMEQEKNRVLFRQFKGELKEKYPESSRRCY
ncbi:beta-1,4-glucuronyltransferase 1-like [Penaeus japonicus]|uniref:beta-1,4-glucuronyltransferase 1-like n=1 Tax=Penaeus japonicus TaxID=27405 RepID=UPI001C711F77|nr:beta-1,4-glucuronyltransferase 1-like [Penaeus japonicus]